MINAKVTIADLIPERGTTEYDVNNLIHLAFRSDTIYVLPPELMLNLIGLNIDTIVTLEQIAMNPTVQTFIDLIPGIDLEIPFPDTQEVSSSLFNLINADIIEPFDIEFDEFNNATFSSGELAIGITNNLPAAIESATINIVPGSGIEWEVGPFQLLPGETYDTLISLNGLFIENSNSIQIEIVTLDIEDIEADLVELTPETGFAVSFAINNVAFENITLPLGGDTVDVDLALFEDFDSGLILEDPRFTIKVDNPFLLAGNIDGELVASSQDGVEETLIVDLSINPNSTSSVTYYNDDIGDIIQLPPNLLEYEANASLNFNSIDIVGNEALKLGVDIDFPLSVNAANLSLKDTIKFDALDYDITKIERILLHYNLVNGFPLGTEFNLILHDSLNPMINLDTLEFRGLNNTGDNIINPAIVDLFGEVLEPVVSSGILTLSESEINNFMNTNKIIIDITLSSASFQDANQYVKIYSHHQCLFKVGLETKINLE